jgi:hypothetical protein
MKGKNRADQRHLLEHRHAGNAFERARRGCCFRFSVQKSIGENFARDTWLNARHTGEDRRAASSPRGQIS